MKALILVESGLIEERASLMLGGRLAAIHVDPADPALPRIGDIRPGRVTRIEPALGGAFVDCDGTAGFLPEARGLAEGEQLPLQYAVPAHGHKLPEFTRDLGLAGFRLTFRPRGRGIGFSRRLDPAERDRITALLPRGQGWLVRGHAQGCPDELLVAEAAQLTQAWAATGKGEHFRDGGALARLWREAPDAAGIVAADPVSYAAGRAWTARFAPDHTERLTRARADDDRFTALDGMIEAASQPDVPLAGGGRLVIEPGRTLAAVDVDSGDATAGDRRSLVRAVNRRAIPEIAWQLRLREIGGLVVIDFLKDSGRADPGLIEGLRHALAPDPAAIKIAARFSEFGTLELTRERRSAALAERHASPEGLLARLARRAVAEARQSRGRPLLLTAGPDLAARLDDATLARWAAALGCPVTMRSDVALRDDRFSVSAAR
ncbi:MAG: ribonuclease E/G [Ferrovibrionaceae bacterium]